MRIWSILLIKSDLKWCIHLSRSLFSLLQLLGECHCCYTKESPRAHVAKFYGRLRLIRSVLRASKISVLRGAFSFLSLGCQSKKYNTDLCTMYYISSNKSPWWCAESFIPVIYWNTADLILCWHWNYLPQRASCKILRTHMMQDIVRIWYVAARKLCIVVAR